MRRRVKDRPPCGVGWVAGIRYEGMKMKPSPARTLYFWTAIIFLFVVPGWVLSQLMEEPFWRDFLCHRRWYMNWETMLAILVTSFLHHLYWLGRKGGGANGEAVATTLLIHGLLIFPLLVIIRLGVQETDPAYADKTLWWSVFSTYFLYWLAMAWMMAKIECVWPALGEQGRTSIRKRLWLLFALPFVTIVASYILIGVQGPCYILSMP